MATINKRGEYVLAVLSTADREWWWTPVQVQKLFFLLDRRIAERVGGPYFNFTAYDYGPFDADVYSAIESLEPSGLTEVSRPQFEMKRFRLTADGQGAGQAALQQFDANTRQYIVELSTWVRSQPFPKLVSAVYREYPEMRARSVFKE